jgi:hypothetical protein
MVTGLPFRIITIRKQQVITVTITVEIEITVARQRVSGLQKRSPEVRSGLRSGSLRRPPAQGEKIYGKKDSAAKGAIGASSTAVFSGKALDE